jgi:hypothetical protein
MSVSWGEFADSEPALATACRSLLYQFGVGLAFLATVRGDGGPRVHPISPLITQAGLYAFLVPSPKRIDLLRDSRYALHSFPADDNEDAAYLVGEASPSSDARIRRELEAQLCRERDLREPPSGLGDHDLFELRIERCLRTITKGHGDPNPQHVVWRAP